MTDNTSANKTTNTNTITNRDIVFSAFSIVYLFVFFASLMLLIYLVYNNINDKSFVFQGVTHIIVLLIWVSPRVKGTFDFIEKRLLRKYIAGVIAEYDKRE